MKIRVWVFLLICQFCGSVFAGTMFNKNTVIAVEKTSNSSARAVARAGTDSDFLRLLDKPFTIKDERADFDRLMDMPFKLKDLPADSVTARTSIAKANLAKALTGGVHAYLAGEAFGALMNAACVRLAGGSMQMSENGLWEECVKEPPTDEFEYAPAIVSPLPWSRSATSACQAGVAHLNSGYQSGGMYGPVQFVRVSPHAPGTPAVQCETKRVSIWDTAYGGFTLESRVFQGEPSTETYQPTTPEAAAAKIAEVAMQPQNLQDLTNALKDYLNKGGEVETEPLTVTGPSSSPTATSTSTTTTQTPTGPQTTTTTTTTTNKYTYVNNVVNVTTITNTVVKGPNGEVISDDSDEKEPDDSFSDSDLPKVPDFYDPKFPDGMQGVWDQHSVDIKSSSLFSFAAKLMPSVQDGGQCPVWNLPLNFATWANFGTKDVAPPCEIWAIAKAILIVSALLLARALIFGG